MERTMVVLGIVLIVMAEVIGLYWWRRTSKRRSPKRVTGQNNKQSDKNYAAFMDYLTGLHGTDEFPVYPPLDEGGGSEFVTFYTIIRGGSAKVAAAISEKLSSYEEAYGRRGDLDAKKAANTIKEMLKAQSDNCSFLWGTNSVEYRLHRDRGEEYMFVEIMKRPR
jgi:hypothetical protein